MAFDPNTLNLAGLEQQHGLPTGLLQSVMTAESAGNPKAVSPAGAQGLFQFMPATAKAYGINPFDPQQAAVGAARMYGDLSKQFGGDVPSMLAAYNWGSGNLTKKGIQNAPQETRNYIQRVQGGMKQYAQANTGNMTDAAEAQPETMDVELPDGTIVEGVPAGITQAQLMGMLNKKGISPYGYMQRVGEDVSKAVNKSTDIITGGNVNPLSGAIQLGSQAANIVAAPIAEAGVSAFRSLPQNMQEGIGNVAETIADKVRNTAGGGIGKISEYLDTTASGRAFGDFGVDNPTLQKGLQEVSDTAKAAANIATVLSPSSTVRGVPISSTAGKGMEETGKAIYKSGKKIEAAAKTKLAEELYTPKLTPSVLKDRAANTVAQGVNQKPVYVAPAYEADAIKVLENLPIKKSNTLQKNYNIVSNEVSKEAKALSGMLQKTPVRYKPDFFKNQLDNSFRQLKTDPLIIGDGEKVAERIFNKMKEISAKNPANPHGLLKSRQQFDAWARSKKGSIFDANETAFSTAVREVRNQTNDFIAQTAPNAAVRDSLKKQSQLLGAMDNIQTKIPSAPRTRIGMAAEKVGKFIPDSGAGKLAGVGALGALGFSAPVATAAMATAAGTGYGAYKLATSPLLRKAAGKAIEASGSVIKSAPITGPTLFGEEPPDSPLARFGSKFDRKVTK